MGALAAALVGCGDSADPEDRATFAQDAYPFTFEYPASFEASDDVSIDTTLGGSLEDTTAVALDESNIILLQHTELNVEVSEANIDQAKDEFDALVAQIDPATKGEIGEAAGFPSLTYEVIHVPTPPDGESHITVLFDGDQEYVVNCQSTPEGRDEINAACDEALATLAAT